MEIAAYLLSKAKTVTVLSRSEIPFKTTFGEDVGNIIKKVKYQVTLACHIAADLGNSENKEHI